MSESHPETTTNRSADALADLFDDLAARVQSGEALDWEAIAREHPAHVEELRELLRPLSALRDLSRPAADADGIPLTLGVLGDFRLLRELGRGGMGIVYEAEQVSLGRSVALKVLPSAGALDPRHLQRFKNEARAAAGLHHPHIVPVHAVGSDRGVHFIAMQLVDGVTLAQLIPAPRGRADRASPVGDPTAPYRSAAPSAETAPVAALATDADGRKGAGFYRQAARLTAEAAEALEYAHSLGVVHRDVKPGNLMVDRSGKLWVTDFGLAKLQADAGLTVSGDLLGTLRYMSPEQAMARHGLVDHRTDVYALGATLYELLTGRPAVDGADRQEVLRAITLEEPVAPRKLDRSIPADLETICLKALAKNPDERYQTAAELADDLRRWLGHEPIRAKPPTLRQRVGKWVWRHRLLVRAATAIGLVAAVAVAVIAGLVWRQNDRLAAANTATTNALGEEQRQRGLANDARHEAVETGADTKAFATFLADHILAATRPDGVQGGVGVNVTMAEALEKAEPKLAEVFAGRPKAEALARHHIGVTWRNLGRYAEAGHHLRRAVELRRKHLGPGDAETLLSVNSLAVVLSGAGRETDALPLYEEVFERLKATLGPDHLDTLTVMGSLAICYSSTGRRDRTLTLSEEECRLRTARDGPDHPATLAAVARLGHAYSMSDRAKEAIPLLERARIGLIWNRGLDHMSYFHTLNNLGDAFSQVGLAPKAIPLLERARDGMTQIIGPDHPHTLQTECNLGVAYVRAGRADEALSLLKRVREKFDKGRGPDDRITRDHIYNLVFAYSSAASSASLVHLNVGRTADAIALLEQLRDSLPANDPDFPVTLAARLLVWAYREAGRFDEAIALCQKMVDTRAAKYGVGVPNSAEIDLCSVYESAGRFDRSIPLYEDALTRARAKLGDANLTTLSLAASLGSNYRDAGRVGDAARVFDVRLHLARARPRPVPEYLALGYLLPAADAYRKAGQPDRAAELEAEAMAVARKYIPPGDGRKARLLAGCGRVLLRNGKPAEAEPMLRASLVFLEKAGPGFLARLWEPAGARAQLGGALLGQRKYAEAEPLLLAGYAGLKEREKALPPPDKARLPQAADWLVELYTAVGKPDEAAKWRAERTKYDLEAAPPPRKK